MPNRLIKESICTSDNLDRLSWFEEAFFFRLIVNCDDFGRMDARPAIIRSRLFPLKTVTDAQIDKALQSLRSADMIDIYEVDGRSFLQMRTWEKHQCVRAKKSKYPAPDESLQAYDSKCMQMHADVPVIQSESNPNPNPNKARFTPPTLEEMTAYFLEKGGTEHQAAICYSFYDSKDWMVGKTKMKKWKSAVTGWIARDKERGYAPSQPKGGMTSAWDSYESF